MDKTTVKVYFRITGDDFNPQIITDKLNIEPTQCWQKNTDEKPKWNRIGPKNAHRLVGKELKSFDQALKNYSKEHKQAQIKPRPRWFSSWYISTDN